ncbi:MULTISPECIES: HAMP domain-containing sensor histidine kinase [Pseudomonas]|uniref:sensor histidine kinase n=1 Tax=Pseudomonas TaxID=286 RepID=UPI0008760E4E|nr:MULTISPECIES: ATP-binding protein [Pseudomonas]TFA81595.1 two-component system sensor histidine kinase HydH [Pseudomonas sp. LAIL14HWK12:I2]SCZ27357.1 two-component system, NtrC family, sensor histidine kinase HydH [Pseudomonas sp. NFIX46]SDB07494.1 two-component system, NtrC family, sensor histidine kinase HydH [Pseudomonas putida]SFQ83450.1 two-component system, NtrC family, sensor histidine kinase HydH [Pseudomonas sp. NFIX49]
MQRLEEQKTSAPNLALAAIKSWGGQFNLLRWFSLASFFIIAAVALGLGYISTRFVVTESVERDALLTAQFVQAIGDAEMRHANITPQRTMGEMLDPRQDHSYPDVDLLAHAMARAEFLDHVEHLPDVLLATVYALDRTIIWSTNPELINVRIEDDDELDESFEMKVPVSSSYHKIDDEKPEQRLSREPKYLFIENYIPMFNADKSKVVAMVEIYKEPADLVDRIDRGFASIWAATILGGAVIYLGLFWIVRRASSLLQSQQQQLISNETFVALGEMSSAVAHSLRNPLATIRSSAELAQEIASPGAQRNIGDIISQVDRMSRWVRELLVSLRPMSDDGEAVDLLAAVEDTLGAFDALIRRNGVEVRFTPQDCPPVVSQQVLLTQILNSLFANALEAMPRGGVLSVEIETTQSGQVRMTLSDTGKGMSAQQQQQVFKPFFTTKQGGLGVGLALVKRIMERFQGSVVLTSREQEGTRVSLNFRVASGGEYGTQHSAGRG